MAIDTALSGVSVGPQPYEPTRNKLMDCTEGTKILDIRHDIGKLGVLKDIRNGLRPENGGEKTLPTLLLYDAAGMRLFEKITYLNEYYLTNAEIEVLETYAIRIAERIRPGSIIVELGSGNLRKVKILLKAMEHLKKDIEYYALDLSLDELKRTFSEIPTNAYKHVKCFGLHGTYDDGLEWLKSPQISGKPKTVLWLGSSIGNFKRDEAKLFLRGFQDALQPGDMMLIGIDSCKDSNRIFHAYNDKENVTHQFILNGLSHANRLLGQKSAFKIEEWKVIGEVDEEAGRHQAFVTPLRDVVVDGIHIREGEKIRIEESYKYSPLEIEQLWDASGLVEGSKWATKAGEYAVHLVSKPRVFFPMQPKAYASHPMPTLFDWDQLWAAWDAVTLDMIPEDELLSKPIKLRNACIFYLGHIPTFLDIHIARAIKGEPTEPKYYRQIFERGIDPDVDNPELCHSHSEIPDSWPPFQDVLRFQNRVRQRVKSLYDSNVSNTDRCVGRALWIGYEHEIMHLETLLYMLVQSEKICPPPGVILPDFEALARQSAANAAPNQWFTIPEADVTLGLDDPETNSGPDRYFGWDNEKPKRKVHVGKFFAKARPITNGEFAEYLEKTGNKNLPASWCESPYITHCQNGNEPSLSITGFDGYANGSSSGTYVRTVFGAVPLKHALDWPVVASYDELVSCANWMGGRIPTMEEVRSIYAYVDRMKSREADQALGKTIPAVNSHLVNDGVEESPPSHGFANSSSNTDISPNANDLFINLEGTNTGFKHWHPVPVTQSGGKLCGQSEMGGVWEWTSTVLEKHDGFEAMGLYPGYTADFFDGKHNIVLGGSWATHPRIAGRTTFVNWYQRNYPYVWAGARVVRDN
ncbi:hypothetical protein K432DRAFT_383967 [Lepidopterella palustris CBS 459.81]|uniref:N-methyltransferase n=1 Tax=Lepidopterella palustris CBS 459.81 TaxID=1314670 RepID=A0A8E2E6Y8_9PEZI|nr:hypothetical protein K432DRAFT_383967 [Lepidopterella palustris CBS 459.81]